MRSPTIFRYVGGWRVRTPFMAVWDTNKEAHLEGGREARVEGGRMGDAGSERERAAESDPLTEGGETEGLWRVVKAWS